MTTPVIIMPVHGMGDTRLGYDQQLKRALRARLGNTAWQAVIWQAVYYQDVMQRNQRRLFERMRDSGQVDWLRLRRFLLFGFSDAAGMEMKPQQPGSLYEQIQARIVATLDRAWVLAGERAAPVLIVAHSLGGQIVSNYLWDAQCRRASVGVFRPDRDAAIGGRSAQDRFRRLKSLAALLTTGCNIPIFIAGLPAGRIRPVAVNARGWRFRWENYYDRDDALGWPLRPINAAYRRTVAIDRQISVGSFPQSFTPLSHNAYWRDAGFLRPLERAVRAILAQR